jgi:arabinofuranosyltransferase
MIGWFGYYAGPEVHIVDPVGLGDPLLARLPSQSGPWRTGHWFRNIPRRYLAIAANGGELREPELEPLWSDIKLVTRGPLLSLERFKAIFRLNTQYQDSVEAYCTRACSVWQEEKLKESVPVVIPSHGVAIAFAPRVVARVKLKADPGHYRVQVQQDETTVFEGTIEITAKSATLELPSRLASRVRVQTSPPGVYAKLRELSTRGW